MKGETKCMRCRDTIVIHFPQWEQLLQALHDAINSPKGVVPDSALEFYDPKKYYEDEPDEDPRQMKFEL